MKKAWRPAAAAVLLVGSVAALPAQPAATALPVGASVEGELGREPRFESGIPYRVYRFAGERGREYEISVRSEDFDTRVWVARPSGVIPDLVAEDDDGGEGTNSWLRFAPRASGSYLLVVQSYDTAGGHYRLELRERAQTRPTVQALEVGRPVAGELGALSPAVDLAAFGDPAARYALHAFRASAGRRLRLDLRPGEAFAGRRLQVVTGRVRPDVSAAAVADSVVHALAGGSLEERAVVRRLHAASAAGSHHIVAPQDGEYVAMVVSDDARPVSYVLTIEEDTGAAPAPAPARALRPGEAHAGQLRPGPGPPAERYDQWTLTAAGGERISASLTSDDFDTYLVVGRVEGGRFRVIAEDDDGGEGTDSRLSFLARDPGEYLVRVRAFSESGAGAYALTVIARAPRQPQRRPLSAGAEAQGTLDAEDAALEEDGSPYEEWTYPGTPGERLTIVMRSREFDTFLIVGNLKRERFVEFSRSDDAEDDGTAGERVSRAVVVVPADGQLLIRANTFGPEQGGRYTIRVERSAAASAAGP